MAEARWNGTIITLDAVPYIPEDWELVEHVGSGTLDVTTAKFGVYTPDAQRGNTLSGTDLRPLLVGQRLLNANVLDFLLERENERFIPDVFDFQVYFWGTVYRWKGDGSLCVRYLSLTIAGWGWEAARVTDVVPSLCPATILLP